MTKKRAKRGLDGHLLRGLAFCVFLTGCSNKQAASLAFDPSRPEVPCVMLDRAAANDGRSVSGPLVGVWADGRIVRVESEGAIGKSYLEGELTEGQLEQLLRFIATHEGLLELEGGNAVPCGGWDTLLIRLQNQRIIYGGSNADMDKLRQYLMSIELAEAHACEPPWSHTPSDWYE